MKKITLMAALLGSAYFANAQVGIGTPTPNASAMLDITATNKGVLIPRVALEVNDDQTTVATPTTSLLVYNTNTSDANVPDVKKVTPGFYYWNVDKWERIVNQSQLDTAITNVTNLQGDVTKIKALLDAAYGSNNLGDTATDNPFGGMVFTPADGSTAAKFEYVKWNATSNSYERLDITSVITDLINASETKTKIVTIEDVQYYVSESYAGAANPIDITDPGVYKIDVVGGVVNNFSEIINSNTTIEGTTQTIKQYFEELGATDSNTVYFNNTNTSLTVGAGSVAAYTFYLKDAAGDPIEINLAALVKDLETDTQITKTQTGTVAAGDVKIDYKYFNEAQPDTTGTPQQVINLNADLKTLIEGNTEIKNAISNVLNAGGNVYYGDHDNSPTTPDVFYTIDAGGNKVAIQISQVVVNAITNATTIQKQEIKNQLGDTYSTTNVVKTGDTWVDGKAIFKSVLETTVLAGTANITGANPTTAGFVTIVGDVSDINVIGIRIIGENGVSASATDLSVDDKKIHFRIGTGSMYNVLSANDLTVKVLVEFSANTTTP